MRLYKGFSPEELDYLSRQICAGYLLFNLAAMREDGLQQALTSYYKQHYQRLPFPEQDTMAVVCRDRVRLLPMAYVVCNIYYSKPIEQTQFYDLCACLPKEPRERLSAYVEALTHPIQLHYIGPNKPWNAWGVWRQKDWFLALWKSGCTRYYLRVLPHILKQRLRRYSLLRFVRKHWPQRH